MTFEKFIKLINILDKDGEILVMEDIGYEKRFVRFQNTMIFLNV